jgi:hypothetical protein
VEYRGAEAGMILSAHQPGFFPYLGTFAKIAQADHFMLFDGVQFERHGYSNRVRIKTHAGTEWLTVPVFHGQPLLKDAKIVPGNWRRKMLRTVELAYRKAPYFDEHYAMVERILVPDCESLALLCGTSIRLACQKLGIHTPIGTASEFAFAGEKSALVLDMCRKLRASSYIFGPMGRDYADVEAFRAAGVEPVFQEYRHPVYRQLHGAFVPGLSVLDLLMNEGPRSREVFLSMITPEFFPA